MQDMWQMFFSASSFCQDLGGWDVGRVWRMDSMFEGATSLNVSLNEWGPKADSLSRASDMFQGTSCLTQEDPDLTLTPPYPFCHD